jgi:hypothetical protein
MFIITFCAPSLDITSRVIPYVTHYLEYFPLSKMKWPLSTTRQAIKAYVFPPVQDIAQAN